MPADTEPTNGMREHRQHLLWPPEARLLEGGCEGFLCSRRWISAPTLQSYVQLSRTFCSSLAERAAF